MLEKITRSITFSPPSDKVVLDKERTTARVEPVRANALNNRAS